MGCTHGVLLQSWILTKMSCGRSLMVTPIFFHPHSRRRSAIHTWSSPAAADFRQIFTWRHPTADSNFFSPRFHCAQDGNFCCFEASSRRQSAMHTAHMQPLLVTKNSFGNIQVAIPTFFHCAAGGDPIFLSQS